MTSQTAKHFNIQFDDLTFEKQEEITDTLKVEYIAEYKQEAEDDAKKPSNRALGLDTQPWQVMYNALYEIADEEELLEQGDQEKQLAHLDYLIDEKATEQAEKKAREAFKITEIEVAL
jgi:hypothetical protein